MGGFEVMKTKNMNMKIFRFAIVVIMLPLLTTMKATERMKYNFNSEWRLQVGDFPEAKNAESDDSRYTRVAQVGIFAMIVIKYGYL